MKDEIKEILEALRDSIDDTGTDKVNFINWVDKIEDYITNLQEDYEKEHYLVDKLTRQLNDEYKNTEYQCKQKEFKDLILKALHKYFTEHEEYENDEFLRQLESCTENDMVWLKRMAGDDNE